MPRKPSTKPKHVAHTKRGQRYEQKPNSHLTTTELDRLRQAVEAHCEAYVPEPAARTERIAYDPAICDIIVADAANGHTLGATCALIGCGRSTLNQWATSNPELAEAIARAKEVRQRMYEGHLVDMVRRGGDSTRMSAVKLGLLNVGGEDWKERLTSEHSVTISLSSLIEESMKLAPPVIDITPSKQPDADDDGPHD